MNKKLNGTAAYLNKVFSQNGGVKKYESKLKDDGFVVGVLACTGIFWAVCKIKCISEDLSSIETKISKIQNKRHRF